MALWLARTGSRGEWETLALEKGLAVVGWGSGINYLIFQLSKHARN